MKLEIKFIDSTFKYGVFKYKQNNSIAKYYSTRDEAQEAINKAQNFYLSYVNDYLSISRMSEDYNISELKAEQLIDIGKLINNN